MIARIERPEVVDARPVRVIVPWGRLVRLRAVVPGLNDGSAAGTFARAPSMSSHSIPSSTPARSVTGRPSSMRAPVGGHQRR